MCLFIFASHSLSHLLILCDSRDPFAHRVHEALFNESIRIHNAPPLRLQHSVLSPTRQQLLAELSSKFGKAVGYYMYPSGRLDSNMRMTLLFSVLPVSIDPEHARRCRHFIRLLHIAKANIENDDADADDKRFCSIGGGGIDATGQFKILGVVAADDGKIIMVKMYINADLTWVYCGHLFTFGIGGRWSQTGSAREYGA